MYLHLNWKLIWVPLRIASEFGSFFKFTDNMTLSLNLQSIRLCVDRKLLVEEPMAKIAQLRKPFLGKVWTFWGGADFLGILGGLVPKAKYVCLGTQSYWHSGGLNSRSVCGCGLDCWRW